jgi:hypothetical protein
MKLAIGLPWYSGPDDNTCPQYLDFMAYMGALRERTLVRRALGTEVFSRLNEELPPLDEAVGKKDGPGEPTEEDWERLGKLDIGLFNRSRISMVGKARELIVEDVLNWGGDFLLWWDADIRFPYSAFLQLLRNKKLVVGALAFTARHPIHPVIYRMRTHDDENGVAIIDGSDVVMDYPRDQLISSEILGGPLAFGAGFVLYDMKVFRELPQPWFNSTGCGEDWFFCHRCDRFGIPRYVDSRVKTYHKEHQPRWACEETYWVERQAARQSYVDIFGENVLPVAPDENGVLWPKLPDGSLAK